MNPRLKGGQGRPAEQAEPDGDTFRCPHCARRHPRTVQYADARGGASRPDLLVLGLCCFAVVAFGLAVIGGVL